MVITEFSSPTKRNQHPNKGEIQRSTRSGLKREENKFRFRWVVNIKKQPPISVIIGPMFSGKSTELIRRCKRYKIANCKCILIKYAKDDRYSEDSVATHDRQTLAAESALELGSIVERLHQFDVIGIDEGQFFPDLVDCAESLANKGKTVIVAALDGTYQREGFANVLQLVPKAESVIKLNAVCMVCFGDAAYTKRISADTEVEVIGGCDKYMALCRQCYRNSPLKKSARGNSQTPQKRRNVSGVGFKENKIVF